MNHSTYRYEGLFQFIRKCVVKLDENRILMRVLSKIRRHVAIKFNSFFFFVFVIASVLYRRGRLVPLPHFGLLLVELGRKAGTIEE